MTKRIRTIRQAIKALGGRKAFQELCSVGPKQVINMVSWNEISHRHHLRVYMCLVELGYQVDVKHLFGYDVRPPREAVPADDVSLAA
jgi:hypothetical protein